jgi:LPS sulfotransferase NodH
VTTRAPTFTSDIELIRAEAIDVIYGRVKDSPPAASGEWTPFFRCLADRRYLEAAAFYAGVAEQNGGPSGAAIPAILTHLWNGKYEDATAAAAALREGSLDGRVSSGIVDLIGFVRDVEASYAHHELDEARPRAHAGTRFVILHEARVGSTWLVASLNQHPRTICYPEVLAGIGDEEQRRLVSLMGTGGLPEIYAVYAVTPKYHPMSPYRKAQIDALGFKTKLTDVLDRDWFGAFLRDHAFRVVRLYRENLLKQAVSLANAQRLFSRRGQYNLRRGIDEASGPLRAESGQLIEMMNGLKQDRQTTDDFVKTLALPTLSFSYEELLGEPRSIAERLGDFLGVEGLEPATTFAKATADRLEEAVENWPELLVALSKTPHGASVVSETSVDEARPHARAERHHR